MGHSDVKKTSKGQSICALSDIHYHNTFIEDIIFVLFIRVIHTYSILQCIVVCQIFIINCRIGLTILTINCQFQTGFILLTRLVQI